MLSLGSMRRNLSTMVHGFGRGAMGGFGAVRGRLGAFYQAGAGGGIGALSALAPAVTAPLVGAEEVRRKELEEKLGIGAPFVEAKDTINKALEAAGKTPLPYEPRAKLENPSDLLIHTNRILDALNSKSDLDIVTEYAALVRPDDLPSIRSSLEKLSPETLRAQAEWVTRNYRGTIERMRNTLREINSRWERYKDLTGYQTDKLGEIARRVHALQAVQERLKSLSQSQSQ
jgi:hypothetical protein